ncbi:MAG: hypothetical protein ACK2UH_10135 [Candidatus Promineifilaceae bacterium]
MAGVGALLRRAIDTRFKKVWLLPALLLMPLIGLLTVGILVLMGEEWPDWTAPTAIQALGTVFFILFWGGGLEGFGWRGYALDRMQIARTP